MKLYTFQPNFIWENIQQVGYHHPFSLFEKDEFLKESLQDSWGFSHAYLWLKQRMLDKGISYHQYNEHMIWAWYQWSGKKSKPDKRFSNVYAFYSQPFVMMELDIHPNRVLLTDYDAWHFVLNYWLLAREEDSDQFSDLHNYYREKPLLDKTAHFIIENSWETIFDMEKSRTLLEYTVEQQCVQATFFEIFKEDVKKVHYFENNKCIKIENFK